jgi:hypothetical protein
LVLEENIGCDMAGPPRSDDDAIVGRGIQEQAHALFAPLIANGN